MNIDIERELLEQENELLRKEVQKIIDVELKDLSPMHRELVSRFSIREQLAFLEEYRKEIAEHPERKKREPTLPRLADHNIHIKIDQIV